MKTKNIVKALRDILDLDNRKKKKNALVKILKRLKKNETALKKKIGDAKGGKQKKSLLAQLKVIRAQRKKGETSLARSAAKG